MGYLDLRESKVQEDTEVIWYRSSSFVPFPENVSRKT